MCQARWPKLTKFDAAEVATRMADFIVEDYPLSDQRQEMQITITPTGITQQPGEAIHRFQSVDRRWTVTLADQFISLDTLAYEGHVDFIQRLGAVFDALLNIAQIPVLARLGYRYTNRLDQPEDMPRLKEYFAAGILGGLAQDNSSEVAQTVSETLFKDGDTFLMVRSALLGPNASIDPALDTVPTPSWIVDLDSYAEPAKGLAVDTWRERAEALSERASSHFRQIVTPEFIARFK
jgi:uncharacterized protein (TIGR04255 family)